MRPHEPRILAAGELQQAGDQVAHLVRLPLEIVEQPLPLSGVEPLLLRQHLDVRLHARQRRAQLVRGVGHEAPLRLDRVPECPEHCVERGPEPRQLAATALRHALARVLRPRDPLRRRRQAAHGGEGRPRDERAGNRGDADAAERHEQQDQPQMLEVRDGQAGVGRGLTVRRHGHDDVPGEVAEAAERPVRTVLERGRVPAQDVVHLCVEVVAHDEVDGHRRGREHDRDDCRGHERESKPEAHGSRST